MQISGNMHRNADLVGAGTPIAEVAKLIEADDVGYMAVGKNDGLVGMVSLGGVAHSVNRELAGDLIRPSRATMLRLHCGRRDAV